MNRNKIAVVFGGTGFLGHAVIQKLAAAGYQIRVPTRHVAHTDSLKPLARTVGQILPLQVNVMEEAPVQMVLQGADLVINLLGILSENRRQQFQQMHVETPARLARLAKEAGASRFVHVSALGVQASSASRYARTKAMGESAVRAFFPSAVILKPSIMFGPRDSFLNRFALMARFLPFLPLIGGGRNKMQPVYVNDVAEMLLRTLMVPTPAGLTLELAGPNIYTFQQLMSLILRTGNHHALLIPIPWWLARIKAFFFEFLPKPPLTRDELELLKIDNILPSEKAAREVFAAWGITPRTLEAVLPTYLV